MSRKLQHYPSFYWTALSCFVKLFQNNSPSVTHQCWEQSPSAGQQLNRERKLLMETLGRSCRKCTVTKNICENIGGLHKHPRMGKKENLLAPILDTKKPYFLHKQVTHLKVWFINQLISYYWVTYSYFTKQQNAPQSSTLPARISSALPTSSPGSSRNEEHCFTILFH